MTPFFDRIVSDPSRMEGQPTIRGTRLTVKRVLSLVATYLNRAELFEQYPQLTDAGIVQALNYQE